MCRCQRETVLYLAYVFRNDLEGNVYGFGNVRTSAYKQILIALYVLGTEDSYRQVLYLYIEYCKTIF